MGLHHCGTAVTGVGGDVSVDAVLESSEFGDVTQQSGELVRKLRHGGEQCTMLQQRSAGEGGHLYGEGEDGDEVTTTVVSSDTDKHQQALCEECNKQEASTGRHYHSRQQW